MNTESINPKWFENVKYLKPIQNNRKSCLIRDIIEIEGYQFLYESNAKQGCKTKGNDLKVRHFIDNKGKGCPLCGSKIANQSVCKKATTHIFSMDKYVEDGYQDYFERMEAKELEKKLGSMFP
ncbi:hypothetical protein [Planococcus versutus]|uniref:hypothetical protein n=1 Tax=Planococcus versutus TaxID=1302659 RepID=UPI0013904727|nr:hypothetical protein [Planococcus versutus]